jgi:outer membrane protein assembly factor BamB
MLYGDGVHYIVLGSCDNNLYVIDEDGNLKWKYETEGAILSKATLVDINKDKMLEVLFGSCDNNIYCLSSTGQKLWSYETDFWVVATPIVFDIDGDGRLEVVVGSYDHNLYILDSQGSFMLDYTPGISGVTQQTGHYGDMMTSEPGQLYGKKLWQYQTEGIIVGCTYLEDNKNVVLNTEVGKVKDIYHKQRS